MPLDFVHHHFLHPGSTAAIQRTFIDMPVVKGKICLIRKVLLNLVELDRIRSAFDVFYAISVDPDHVLDSFTILDSTIFLHGSYNILRDSSASFNMYKNPEIFDYMEGIRCPYSRLPFFVQNSNTNSQTANYNLTVFYELIALTPQELAVAVMRRGRGVTRRVP